MGGVTSKEVMKKVTRYQCQFCKKDFKTPDRHQCKKDPKLKNCFTCRNLKGWLGRDYEVGDLALQYPPYPDCAAGTEDPEEGGWDIGQMKNQGYNMQCSKWGEGRYNWIREKAEDEPEGLW